MPDVGNEIERTRRALDDLNVRVGAEDPDALQAALTLLGYTLEELEVAYEELQQQNTELAATQQALSDERQAFEDLFELAPDAYMETDAGGTVLRANRQSGELLGVPPEKLVGHSLARHVPVDRRMAFRARLVEIQHHRSQSSWDATFETQDGEPVLVSVQVAMSDTEGGGRRLRWLVRDVTAAREAETALKQQFVSTSERAEILTVLGGWKDTFMAAAAHDVRAPISVIISGADTLSSRPDLGPDLVQQIAGRMGARARHLDVMLQDLLDLERFTWGVVEPDLHPTDVARLVERAVTSADLGDHPISVETTPVRATVDGPRVSQIVDNLLRNAVRHTAPGTPIHVRTSVVDDHVQLVVEDEGSGVPPEIRESLFTPFVRASSDGPGGEGSGIGLSLVLLFAELHGGTARVEDRPGGGARFVVLLPLG